MKTTDKNNIYFDRFGNAINLTTFEQANKARNKKQKEVIIPSSLFANRMAVDGLQLL